MPSDHALNFRHNIDRMSQLIIVRVAVQFFMDLDSVYEVTSVQ
jgi:hypothetical protein